MTSKKHLVIALAVMSMAFIAVYMNLSQSFEANTKTSLSNFKDTNQALQYTCPMHPEVVMDKPGHCPKCGMDLVLKTDNQQDSTSTKSVGCKDMSNCKNKGCSKETCMGSSGGCSENCPAMKDHKDMDTSAHHSHGQMNHKKCNSDNNSGCMGH